MIINILDKSLKWVWDNIKYFDITKTDNQETIKIKDITLKMFGELCLTFLLLNRCNTSLSEKGRMYKLLIKDFIHKILCDPFFYEKIFINPRLFWIYGLPISYYLEVDEDPLLKSIVQKTYKVAKKTSVEIVPFRQMDNIHTMNLLSNIIPSIQNDKKIMDKYIRLSILDSNLDITLFELKDEYALTHAIFYGTSFGQKKLELSTKKINNIKEYLSILALSSVIRDDCDILGEYIMCFINLNIQDDVLECCVKYLCKRQLEDGTFPNRNSSTEIQEDFLKNNSKADYVRKYYHTVLVAIMALTLYTNKYGK